ncbi:hypothetical protein [Ekhidna sp.]|uniref:hypothetical protein n=1 Tax=Ekhidna sp. TaxID=2608089 RepID=UPI003BAA189C
MVLGYIFYEYYGLGDSITFFESARLSKSVENQPRTQFFIKILTPLVALTKGSYWLTSLWLSFISFLGSWFATVTFIRLFPKQKSIVIASFLFIPSIIFWSSGIMKDTLAYGALMILISLIVKLYEQYKLRPLEVILVLIMSFTLIQIKHYLFIMTLLFGGILVSILIFKKLSGGFRWVSAIVIFIASLLATQFIHPYLVLDRLPQTLYENNQAILEKSEPNKQLDIVIEDDSWLAVIKEVPKALHAGLLRPNIIDETPIWGWIHRVENLVVSLLMIMSILLCFKLKPSVDKPLLIAALICILILAVMLPLATPNFGTLVRYKNPYMPYLFLISSILPFQYFTSRTSD